VTVGLLYIYIYIYVCMYVYVYVQVPVAAPFNVWVCGHSLAEAMGSNSQIPPGHGCLLRVLCVARWRSLRRADPSSRAVLPSACAPLNVIRSNNNPLKLQWISRKGQNKRSERKNCVLLYASHWGSPDIHIFRNSLVGWTSLRLE